MATIKRKKFLTGGSGVLGEALLNILPHKDIIALHHHNPVNGATIEAIKGSISTPQLGLNNSDYKHLVSNINAVIHCASMTQFVGRQRHIIETNVQGTREMLTLAERAETPLFYISTAFTHHSCQKPAGENPYIDSKLEAEEILKSSSHPITIIRPSIITGNSNTGYIPKLQGFHSLMHLVLEGALPVLPVDQTSYVDFMPSDIIARLIAGIIDKNLVGHEFWLSLGEQRAPNLKKLAQHLKEISEAETGKPLELPKYVSTDMYQRLIKPAIIPALPHTFVKEYRRLEKLEGYFSLNTPLPSSLDILRGHGVTAEYSLLNAFKNDIVHLIKGQQKLSSLTIPTPKVHTGINYGTNGTRLEVTNNA